MPAWLGKGGLFAGASATFAAVTTTVCTSLLSPSAPGCAFIPKYHGLPFLVWGLAGSRCLAWCLVEGGAAMSVASTSVPARSSRPRAAKARRTNCWRQQTRSMRSRPMGGRLRSPVGKNGSMTAKSWAHGMTCSMRARKVSRRVVFLIGGELGVGEAQLVGHALSLEIPRFNSGKNPQAMRLNQRFRRCSRVGSSFTPSSEAGGKKTNFTNSFAPARQRGGVELQAGTG